MLVSFLGFLFYKLPVDIFCPFSYRDYSFLLADFQEFRGSSTVVLSHMVAPDHVWLPSAWTTAGPKGGALTGVRCTYDSEGSTWRRESEILHNFYINCMLKGYSRYIRLNKVPNWFIFMFLNVAVENLKLCKGLHYISSEKYSAGYQVLVHFRHCKCLFPFCPLVINFIHNVLCFWKSLNFDLVTLIGFVALPLTLWNAFWEFLPLSWLTKVQPKLPSLTCNSSREATCL